MRAFCLCIAFLVLVQQSSGRSTPSLALKTTQHAPGSIRLNRRLLDAAAGAQGPVAFDLGEAIEGQVILIFAAGVSDVAAATAQLAAELQADSNSEVAAASAAAEPFEVVSSLGGASSDGAAAASSSSSTAASGIVLRASPAVVKRLRASPLIAKVIPDRVVASQSAVCVEAAALSSQGVTATPSKAFSWPKCLTSKTRLVWSGKTCGGRFVAYTELRAIDIVTGATARASGKPCILKPDATKSTWTRQRFGSCGRAPLWAPVLPGSLCTSSSSTLDSEPTSSPPSPSPSPAPPSPPVESSPSPSPAVDSPSPSPSIEQPQPTGPRLPRVPVAAGEQLPTGVVRIEAASSETGAVSTAGLALEQQVVVGVLDSGLDATHPDINYVGGKAWNKAAAGKQNDDAPDTDNYGHGTHVGGIIGARNNGAGVVGVSPGVPLFSLKVLDGTGKGSLSSVLSAVKWVVGEGASQGIRVINLSLAAFVDPTEEDYADTVDVVCSVFAAASEAGVFVSAAAGNYGSDLRGYLPAACTTLAAVTAIEGSAPASFSNYLPAGVSSDAEKAHVIAAPGSNILSTISFARDASGYKVLSGTSQASPHVAGIAANCVMSGACARGASGASMLAVVQAAAAERYATQPDYGFAGDARQSASDKFYGLLSWAGKF